MERALRVLGSEGVAEAWQAAGSTLGLEQRCSMRAAHRGVPRHAELEPDRGMAAEHGLAAGCGGRGGRVRRSGLAAWPTERLPHGIETGVERGGPPRERWPVRLRSQRSAVQGLDAAPGR